MALTDSEKRELVEYVLSQLKSGAENIKEITEINNASNVSSIVGYNKDGNMVKINQMYIPRPLGSFEEYKDFIARLDELWYDETNVFQKERSVINKNYKAPRRTVSTRKLDYGTLPDRTQPISAP
jgi:hypothetical protein